jgi:hypothetical protein
MALFEQMASCNVKRDGRTYCAALKCCGGDLSSAEQLWNVRLFDGEKEIER